MAFWDKDKVATTESGIAIKAIREDSPRFKREYTATLDNRASIKIEIYRAYGMLMKNGTLTQPNGRWVLFEPDRIADKILDPILVPKVQARVDEIFQLDRNFRHNAPGEFVDESGTKWTRV